MRYYKIASQFPKKKGVNIKKQTYQIKNQIKKVGVFMKKRTSSSIGIGIALFTVILCFLPMTVKAGTIRTYRSYVKHRTGFWWYTWGQMDNALSVEWDESNYITSHTEEATYTEDRPDFTWTNTDEDVDEVGDSPHEKVYYACWGRFTNDGDSNYYVYTYIQQLAYSGSIQTWHTTYTLHTDANSYWTVTYGVP